MIQLKHHQWTGPSAWWKPSVWVSSGLWGHPAQGWALIRHPETVWLQVYSFVRDRSSSQWTGAHTCSRVSFLLQLWEQNFTSACWRPQTVTAPVCPLMRFSRFYCFWWFYIFFCFKRFSVVFVVYGVFFIILLFLFLFIILFFLLFFLLLFLMVLLLDSDKWRDLMAPLFALLFVTWLVITKSLRRGFRGSAPSSGVALWLVIRFFPSTSSKLRKNVLTSLPEVAA